MKLPKIAIYDKYIFNQVMMATCVAILLFIIVWIAPEMLLNTIKKTLSGEYGIKTAILVLTCELPKILGKAFPAGLLLGTLFTFDKLSKDSELTIFRAVGLSFKRIVAPVIALSLICTYLCFLTSDKLIPLSADKMEKIKGYTQSTQFIYTQKDKDGHPNQTIVVSKSRGKKLYNIIVLDFSKEVYTDVHQLSNIYYAKNGQIQDDKWILSEITKYKITKDGIFENIDNLQSMTVLNDVTAPRANTLMAYSTKKEREINNKNLKKYVKLLKEENMDEEYRLMLNKYFQRYFHPFVCILLAVMGCLLGFSKPREQRVIGFAIAIGCIVVYYITLPFFDLLAEKGVLPPLITSTFPLMAFLVAIVMFYRSKEL